MAEPTQRAQQPGHHCHHDPAGWKAAAVRAWLREPVSLIQSYLRKLAKMAAERSERMPCLSNANGHRLLARIQAADGKQGLCET